MDLHLKDKIILIGGASRGIGLGIAEVCLEEGGRVALIARGRDALEATHKMLADRFGADRVWSAAGDVSDTAIIDRIVANVEDDVGPIWGAVANAGLHPCPPGFDVDDETWEAGWKQNLGSAYRFARAVLRRMVPRGQGSLVFISSTAGMAALGDEITYGSAKCAVNHVSKQIAGYVGPSGVRVNTIAPGPIHFPDGIWDNRLKSEKADGWRRWIKREVPLNRLGCPRDIGVVAALLLSPIATFVTGAIWPIDGGHNKA